MPFIYRCEYLGGEWNLWEDGYEMPSLPYDFTQESCTVSFHSHDGVDWCFSYDPIAELITWCNKEEESGWTDWHDIASLPAPPNFILEDEVGIPAFFSVGTHAGQPAIYSLQPDDDSVFISYWSGEEFQEWDEVGFLEPPPNLSEASDISVACDQDNEWVISVNLEDWSVFYCEWDPGTESFSPWAQAPPLDLPEEWFDMGVDVDADAGGGSFWIYTTIYEEDDF